MLILSLVCSLGIPSIALAVNNEINDNISLLSWEDDLEMAIEQYDADNNLVD